MRLILFLVALGSLAMLAGGGPAAAERDARYAARPGVTIHSCAARHCGVTGRLVEGERVTALEILDGWVRISMAQTALCKDGRSAAIDSGDDRCLAHNGIRGGRLTRWVHAADLTSARRPAPPAAKGCAALGLEASDDYASYAKAHCGAALQLIALGHCTARDFQNLPWSASPGRGEGHYFVYCGGFTDRHRFYHDVLTGRVGR